MADPGHEYRPSGAFEQWGQISALGGGSAIVHFATAFPTALLNLQVTAMNIARSGGSVGWGVANQAADQFDILNLGTQECFYFWRAIGH
ncbi:MAG: gp53-like domain-containing protein [Bryobacteraceae bacterium]